ncbi:dipeptide epimerase [Candidatus Sumerlaeota bacterium]|nr:dipeptide epimerase [Candidatus Sumerlaeota bacterium]
MTRPDGIARRVLPFEKRLEHPFGIASITVDSEPGTLLQIGDSWGEASPSRIYGETVDGTLETLRELAPLLPTDGRDPTDYLDDLAQRIPGQRSALCAIDTALHDLWARAQGQPLWRLLGADPSRLPTSSFTIGIDDIDVMIEKVETVGAKSPILKIKLGRNPDGDCEVMRQIREAAPDKTLRVDANQGWTLSDAKRLAPILADLGVEYIEQPLRRGQLEAARELKRVSPLPIFLDEDSHFASDIPRLAEACHGVNIKLMKTGGLTEALRMIAAARAHGLQVMIGCMVETSVAITAAAQIAPLCDHVDLDGHVLITNDPFEGCGWDQGRLTLSETPGLGLRVIPGSGLG